MKRLLKTMVALILAMSLMACCGIGIAGDGTGTGSAKGMNGDIEVTVKIEGDKIIEIEVTHSETQGLGDVAIDKLKGDIIDNQTLNLDSVTGATLSSVGFLEAIKLAIQDAGGDLSLYEAAVAEKEKETREITVDVVVVGGGGAGFASAISANEAGANVILLEKLAAVGGNTRISGGEMAAPANWIQEKEGIEDSPEKYIEDLKKAGGDDELIKILAENATPAAEWMRDDVGIEFLDSLMFFGGHSVKRSVIPLGHSGVEIIEKYKAKANELGIEVLTEHDVKELLVEDGKVVGVKAATPYGELIVHAKAVVLATGGFGANAEMLYKYDKEIDDKILSTNSPGATGDGILMAEAIGADTVDMDKIQLYPICDVDTGKLLYVGDTRMVGGALLVNKEGKRFVEELDTRRAISMGIKAQTGSVGYLLWDEKSSEATGTIYSHASEAAGLYERGYLFKADTIAELAEHFEIDVAALEETVANFNENSKNGVDPEFNLRNVGFTVDEAPFYIMVAVPATHHTMGGLKINADTEVINKEGNAIPGLFAAGEVTGGIHGSNRLGSSAIADITVFGRISGENAAKYALGE
ncbi:MAG: flavocytochrome c [Christensenellaceae bacterium]|nr:flavocytochrome c [Christensenellaceae bacterium]